MWLTRPSKFAVLQKLRQASWCLSSMSHQSPRVPVYPPSDTTDIWGGTRHLGSSSKPHQSTQKFSQVSKYIHFNQIRSEEFTSYIAGHMYSKTILPARMPLPFVPTIPALTVCTSHPKATPFCPQRYDPFSTPSRTPAQFLSWPPPLHPTIREESAPPIPSYCMGGAAPHPG